jgi:hypothetical protein
MQPHATFNAKLPHHDTKNKDSQRPLETERQALHPAIMSAIPSILIRATAHGSQRRTNDPNRFIPSLRRQNAVLSCGHVTSKQLQQKGVRSSLEHLNRRNRPLDINIGMQKSGNQQDGGPDNVYV